MSKVKCSATVSVSWSLSLDPLSLCLSTSGRKEIAPNCNNMKRKMHVAHIQSCKMSQIWQIYLCKNIEKLG